MEGRCEECHLNSISHDTHSSSAQKPKSWKGRRRRRRMSVPRCQSVLLLLPLFHCMRVDVDGAIIRWNAAAVLVRPTVIVIHRAAGGRKVKWKTLTF